MPKKMNYLRSAIACLMLLSSVLPKLALSEEMTAADLIEMDFDELINLNVSIESAGKNETRALDLAYAGYVITAAEIFASGVQTIPDALRLAPGVEIGQISASEWSVGVRGAGGRYSRYVLVMVDGRIVYNNVFTGVNWDELNINLQQIERIEVIRGPNASTWGANAVNGIIHIITQDPQSDQPSGLSVVAGGEGHAALLGSWSRSLSEHWQLGLGLNAARWDGLKERSGERSDGEHRNVRLSGSAFCKSGKYSCRIDLDAYQMQQSPRLTWFRAETFTEDIQSNNEDKSGFSLQSTHHYQWSDSGHWKLRASIDDTQRDAQAYTWDGTNYQFDFEVGLELGRQRLNGGIYNRLTDSTIYLHTSVGASFIPARRHDSSYGIFANYTLDITKAWEIALGLRVDDSDLSKVNAQPSVRSIWRLSDSDRLWAALSEAASTPPRALSDANGLPYAVVPAEGGNPPILITLNGYLEQQDSPRLRAIELGYRKAFAHSSVDLALFQYEYIDEVGISPAGPPQPIMTSGGQLILEQAMVFDNRDQFKSHGGEFVYRNQIKPSWSMQVILSHVKFDEGVESSSTTASYINTLELNEQLKWFLALRYNEGNTAFYTRIVDYGDLYGKADNYLVADSTLQWSLNKRWQLDLIARNLGSGHAEALREEYSSQILVIEPSAMLRLHYRF